MTSSSEVIMIIGGYLIGAGIGQVIVIYLRLCFPNVKSESQ